MEVTEGALKGELSWEYIGEELAVFWNSPYGYGKEKIASFWWPVHPPELTGDVEKRFENIAATLCVFGNAINPDRPVCICHPIIPGSHHFGCPARTC
jgi:hypothetical protein